MTAPTAAIEADRALKVKHRAMWALGDYPALAADIIPGLGQVLVTACGVRAAGMAALPDPAATSSTWSPARTPHAVTRTCPSPGMMSAARAG